ncbi:trypsin 3A1-like [Episyrphus balteatus]|uniref:trypsin 3A1-like n=1 Tax=Episyrphus balteatus TaxID=286459 RepID=UPI0024868D3D|nr:trypsin 3A1-like [Episyrphus balteatus]
MIASKMFRHAVVLVVILWGLWIPCAVSYSISGRIVGGKNANDIDLPWMVSIRSSGTHICGGSIINKRTILTAAHCLKYGNPKLLKIRVGSKYKSSGGQLVDVQTVSYHSDFLSSTMDYDIGAIRLAEDLEFSDSVQPIALPAAGEDVDEGAKGVVSGWGYYTPFGPEAQYLQYAEITMINQATCNRLLRDELTDRMVCAGVLTGGVDACQMDSGGPLVVRSKLVGIVSWGISCALPNKPGVYTRVSELVPWVEKYLNRFGETLE